MKNKNKGFLTILLFVALALAVGAGVTYYATSENRGGGSDDLNAMNPLPPATSNPTAGMQQSSAPKTASSQTPQSAEQKTSTTNVGPLVTTTSEMGFTIKVPKGWLAVDEMAGHYTISQTEAAGGTANSNLEISIVRIDTPQSGVDAGFKYCGDSLLTVYMANAKHTTDLVRHCNASGSVMLGKVWDDGYQFIGKSTQTSGNHDADMKVFADVVSSFAVKK